MALSPFSPSSSSSTCTFTSSPSLYFLLQQPTHFSIISESLKFRVSCSNHTVQVETQQQQQSQPIRVAFKAAKKRRKPKPSFFEQIQDKWSLKLGSPREKFPWQVQEELEEKEQQKEEEEEAESEQVSRIVENEAVIGGKELVSDPVSFALPNRVISAPWAHGGDFRNPQFDSEPEISRNGCNKDDKVDGFRGHCENNVNSGIVEREKVTEKGADRKVEFEREIDKIDTISIGISRNEKTPIGGGGVNAVSLNEKQSGIDRVIGNFEDSSDDSRSSIVLPWKRQKGLEFVGENKRVWRRSNTELAESIIPEHELQRLRNVALRMLERIKVGVAGVTQELVGTIHEKWKYDEVVKLKFEEPLSVDMRRTHEILESKTGGLVIWRSGSSVVLFRGMSYKLPCVQSYTKHAQANVNTSVYTKDLGDATHKVGVDDLVRTAESFIPDSAKYLKDLSKEELMDLSDINHLLDELGPRFKDWTGRAPLPVDADLLPSVVPGYIPPFRLLPFRIKPCLRNKEMTNFRRLARTMPPHFVLGRNRELQGLARAMVKLWEKSAIAKIAIKRGVLNTCNERMAEELKKLTGGTLLSRNKDFIVFYRGNDFLPPGTMDALKEREKLADLQQDEEEKARQKASALIDRNAKPSKGLLVAGTLSETMAATSCWGSQPSSEDVQKMMKDLTLSRHASLVRHLEKKLVIAKAKVKKAEKALEKVQESLEPSELPTDLETISDEERFLFRKIGLSMKPYLCLGRRGIFDGTIQNMHLHWKFRELVKIIVKGRNFAQVKHIAISLEAESGGVLVSLDKTTKGYAIIVYRGKNYLRPSAMRPKNLLTRRQALARSIELQRREALKHHILDLQERIELLKSGLEEMKNGKMDEKNTLYSGLEDTYSDDDVEEDEGEEAYLEIYDSGNEDDYNPNESMLEKRAI